MAEISSVIYHGELLYVEKASLSRLRKPLRFSGTLLIASASALHRSMFEVEKYMFSNQEVLIRKVRKSNMHL